MAITQVLSLTGASLDFAVAKAEQRTIKKDPMGFKDKSSQSGYWVWEEHSDHQVKTAQIIGGEYSPSSCHHEGGLIADLNFISRTVEINANGEKTWLATGINKDGKVLKADGETSLVAAMRCYVILRLGATIDLPSYFN